MAYNVKFLRGTAEAYAALTAKDSQTFYYTDDNNLYLGEIKLSNAAEIAAAVTRIAQNETDIDNIEAAIGTLESLNTTAKADLVSAINEVLAAVGAGGTNSQVKLTESSSEDYAKVYTLTQGETTVGTINIPKDMVVESGQLVEKPEGTYIELTLANATNDKIYIAVADLVDIYTAAAGAAEVQLAVSADGVISASLVDGGIATAKIADGAITTIKIADANVTKAKLSAEVQTSLGKADSAVQEIKTGTANGTIAVDGNDVKVTGLGSAAYTNSDAYEAAGAAAEVLGTETDSADANTVYGAKAYAKSLDDAMDARMDAVEAAVGTGGSVETQINDAIALLDADITSAAVEAGKGIQVQVVETDGKVTSVNVTGNYDNAYDTKGAAAAAQEAAATDAQNKADAALASAKTYADNALTWGTF